MGNIEVNMFDFAAGRQQQLLRQSQMDAPLCSPPAPVGDALFLATAYRLAADLAKRFPQDTFVNFTYVPVLRALASQGMGRFADSVERLEITRSYELAMNGLNFPFRILGGLHPAYVRGEALIGAQRYAEAAAEFQRILDHRGIVGLDLIGPLAHLQLGRVFALSGDKARAKAAYEAFLALWKEADPDVPVLRRARAEYAKL